MTLSRLKKGPRQSILARGRVVQSIIDSTARLSIGRKILSVKDRFIWKLIEDRHTTPLTTLTSQLHWKTRIDRWDPTSHYIRTESASSGAATAMRFFWVEVLRARLKLSDGFERVSLLYIKNWKTTNSSSVPGSFSLQCSSLLGPSIWGLGEEAEALYRISTSSLWSPRLNICPWNIEYDKINKIT